MQDDSTVSPVFVGRRDELTLLTDALARADAGEPQMLLLGGEAGVGKTRLLEEFLTAARASGATAAVGGCLELGADGLPFAPFATALRGLHRSLGDVELAAAVAGREAELARLLPDLAPAPGSPGAVRAETFDEEDGRTRLFELTAQLLERIASGRTVVLALEDLHWADRSTRELLGYLYRSLQTSRLVLLATYRADDIHRRHPLRPFLAELDRLRTVRRIELPRLSRAEVHEQIAGIQGVPEPDPEQARIIFRRSDGNPFFVEELTASCATCGISDSLRDLLLVRVEALPDHAQHVLRIAAQGGSAVEHALLAEVSELPEGELLDALRAAVGANVLLPTEDGDGYRFRHALLREAVSEDLLPGEAAALNRRYARALEADPSLVRAEQRTTRLAHYWYRGRDAAKAMPVVLAAAVEARHRHAFAEQQQLLERAIELWHEVPADVRARLRPIDEAEVYPGCADEPEAESLYFMDLLAEAVVAARTGADEERALALTKRALDLLDEEKDPLRAAWFWVKRSKIVEALGRGDGWDEIGRAQELVRGLPPSAVHADVLASAAAWGMMHRPGIDAMSTAVRAVELARVVGATTIELQARTTLGILTADAGNVDGGLAEMNHAREQALAVGAVGVVVRADINIAAELESVGRSREAVVAAARAAKGAAAHGRPDMRAFALGNQAESLHSLGEWAEAARLTDEAGATARSPDTRGWATLLKAHQHLGRGELTAMETALESAREVMGTFAASPLTAVQLRRLSLALAAGRGDFAAARSQLRAALKAGFPPGTHQFAWPLLHTAAAHEAALRGLPAADEGRVELLEEIRTVVRRLAHPAPVWHAHSSLVKAELGRAEGHVEPAAWAEVAAEFEVLERPFQLAQVRQRWAEALLACPDRGDATRPGRERAKELLAEAHVTALRLGAGPLRLEIEQLGARARLSLPVSAADGDGLRSVPSQASPTALAQSEDFGLTQREQDVLGLVAAGRSNRQIAEQLFISPKTASVHVSNILAKLGVAGRGEAAAMAHRLRLLPEADASSAAG